MKKVLSLVLILTMLLSAVPFSASAFTFDNTAEYVYIGNTKLVDGQYLAQGSTTPVTSRPSGGYAHFSDGTLYLDNFTFNGVGYEFGESGGFEHEGITYLDIKTASIYSPGDICISVSGKNSIKNTYKKPSSTDTVIYLDFIVDIFVEGYVSIYGDDGALHLNSDNGLVCRPDPSDYSTDDNSYTIACSEFIAKNTNNSIDVSAYSLKTELNINCKKFFVAAYDGIRIEHGDIEAGYPSAPTLNFNGGDATVYGVNAIMLSDVYDVVGEECVVNATDTKLRIYSGHLGISAGTFKIHSGEVFVDAKTYSLSGLLWLDDSMEVTEGSPFENQFAVAPKNRITADCDINSDGNVNLFDYTTLKSICVKNASAAESVMKKSDVNGDGKTNMFDYMLVKSRYFNPPMDVSSLEGISFDLLAEYITETGFYSSSDKTYSIKATDAVSGTPPFTYALKTDTNRSKIIVSASTKNSNGDTVSAELTMTRENMVGTVKTTVTGSENLSATSSLIINECCVTELDLVGFACSDTGSYTSESFEAETEALIRNALLRIDENWPHEIYVALSDLGFLHF